jgi:hypothetical protein
VCDHRSRLGLCLCLYTPGCYGVDERGVIALVLIGVSLGENGDPTVEDLRGTEVAGDLDRVSDRKSVV